MRSIRCPHCGQELSESEIRSINAQLNVGKRWDTSKKHTSIDAVSPSLPKRQSITPKKSAGREISAQEWADLPNSEKQKHMREEQFKKS